MERETTLQERANGGFPEAPTGEGVRVVRVEHDACGRETRVRLPAALPAETVRRVVCQGCSRAYQAPSVEEVPAQGPGADEPRSPATSPPAWARDPRSRVWRYLSIPVAAAAVIAILMAIQGGDEEPGVPFQSATPVSAPEAEAESSSETPAGDAAVPAAEGEGAASLIRESSFSLALPDAWQRTDPSGGATFAAAAPGGEADATLWVERDPDLSLSSFETRSLDELEALAGSARVVERVSAPTPEDSIVRLAAGAPAGSPIYEVTLRSSGPYRYYLATTVQPDASREAIAGAELVHGSFLPLGLEAG